MANKYIFVGEYSAAHVDRDGDTFVLTGHAVGEPFPARTYLGPDAEKRAVSIAIRVANRGLPPASLEPRSGTTLRGLQSVEIRKVG